MSKISNPAASVAVVAALLLSGIGVGLPIENASADNSCIAAPNAAAPQGEHWYYRSDRQNHRKCWFLHATLALPHQAAAHPSAVAADPPNTRTEPTPAAHADPAPASTEPAAEPPPTAQASASPADGAQPAPHVTVLTVRTVNTPFVGTTPTPPQQQAPHDVTPSPMPQTLPAEANTAGDGVKPADAAQRTPLPPVPDAVRHELATTIDAANAATKTGPTEMFFLLALALGIATIVIVIATRITNRRRAPRLSDDPDTAWIRYRAAHRRSDEEAPYDEQDVPFVDPQGQHGMADLHEQEWADQPPPDQSEYPAAPSQAGDPAPGETAAPSLKDIELALRILRQARQSRVA